MIVIAVVLLAGNDRGEDKKTDGGNVVKQDKEKQRLLKLQQEFSAGNIVEEEISEEDTEKLCKLYDEQIEEIKKSTEQYKKEIIEMRKKLKQAN